MKEFTGRIEVVRYLVENTICPFHEFEVKNEVIYIYLIPFYLFLLFFDSFYLKHGNNAFMLACLNNHLDIVRYLTALHPADSSP